MKIVCDTSILCQACQAVQKAASSKAALPAIDGILLSAENNALTLTAYDLELGIKTTINADIEEEGKIVINAHLLTETLRTLDGNTVEIQSDVRQVATIQSNDFKATLIGMSFDEYPELPVVTSGHPVKIKQKKLKDMIRQTIFSVAVKDSKIVHTGIKFEIENNHIRLIAVDGVRLAIRDELIAYSGEGLNFVVPAKTLSELVKLLDDDENEINIGIGNKHIIFNVKQYSIISRLLDGEFLNYKAAIPPQSKTVAVVDSGEMLNMISRISLYIQDRIKNPVKCSVSQGYINVSAVTAVGTAQDRLKCDISGADCVVGFNNKYLTDVLRVCDTDKVCVKFNGPISPILVTPVEGDSFTFLILPVRLKNED